jgi:hypothetical protein
MLHDSGIKWRVIVVSACYWADRRALRDDNTIVIMAAAPDRTFGCEAGRDFTYWRGVLP